jgi:LmbE family N-acetylglucosaminyl deacetylase
MDDVPQQGAILTAELVDAKAAGDLMAARRLEDERYAYFAEASIVFLDLPDAVFRGYQGDDELLGAPRADDRAPIELLAREITRLEPQKVYLPLGVGGHVDHQLMRDVGVALLDLGRRWVMPGPDYAGVLAYYEDFPYAWWNDFAGLAELADQDIHVPVGLALEARYADISDQLERKAAGLRMYPGQVQRLFDGEQSMLDAVTGHAARVAAAGGVGSGAAERYWSVVRS